MNEKKKFNGDKEVSINGKKIGPGIPTFFIAEIGNNHNGDFYLAKRTIEEAAKAGADAVKLQKRSVDGTFTKELLDKPQLKDQIFGKTYGEYRKNLELSKGDFKRLKKISEDLGLIFFATPFDEESVDFLEDVEVPLYKIASFDATNIPLIEHIASRGKPTIMSVGMANVEETDEAVEAFLRFNNQLVILHCHSVYPTPDEKIHISTVPFLADRYKPIPVGYSGHEQDILPSLSAVVLGARCIERHITIDKALPGPDHASVSITPDQFKDMVDQTRRIENIIGEPEKHLFDEELRTRAKHGKSIVSKIDINAGSTITADMIVCKSPGFGLKPNMFSKLIGKKASTAIPKDTVIVADFIDGL